MEGKTQEHFRTTELAMIPVKAKRTSPKKSIFNVSLVIIVIALGLWFTFKFAKEFSETGEDTKSFIEVFSQMNGWVFSIAVGLLILSTILDAIKYHIIAKTATGGADFRISLKLVLMGRFYDNITPSSTGGQPMQIMYLVKKGYKGGEATAITMTRFFVQMFAWSIVGAVLMIAGQIYLPTVGDVARRTTLTIFAWIGFAMVLSLPIMTVALVVFPKFTTKMLCFFVRLGKKMHIVKNEEAALEKAQGVSENFVSSVRLMCTKPLMFTILIILSILEPILMIAKPYILLVALNKNPFVFENMWQVMCLYMYAHNSAAVFAFSPGTSGALEFYLAMALSGVSKGYNPAWVIFTFRFLTYYINILVGLGMLFFDFIRKKQKQKEKDQTIFDMIVNRKPLPLPEVFKNVGVMLSTYNGEQYLKEQINSILNQKGVNVSLYIRDDGSTDGTINILKEFENNEKVKSIIYGEHLGYQKSYHSILEKMPVYDYYAFAAQDDIWDDEKMLYGVKTLDHYPVKDVPLLYWSSLRLIDSNNEIVKHYTIRPPYGDDSHPFVTNFHISDIKLCTCVVNKIIVDDLITLGKDGYIYTAITMQLICILFGKDFYDPVPHISYRSHSNNSEGFDKSMFKNAKNKLRYLKDNNKENYYSSISTNIYDHYGEYIEDEELKEFLKNVKNYKTDKTAKNKLLKDTTFLPGLPYIYRNYVKKLIKNNEY